MVEKTYRKRRRRKSHYRKKKKTIRGSGSATTRMVRGAYRAIRGVGPKFYPQTKQKDMLEGEGVFRTESFKETIMDYLDEASDKTMSYFKNVYDIIRYKDEKDTEKENMKQAVKLTEEERELSTKIKKFETKAPGGNLKGDPVGMRAIVLRDTHSTRTGVLGVREGEVVEVVREVDENWWMVRHGGVQGLILLSFLQVVLEDGTPFTKAKDRLEKIQRKLGLLRHSVRAVHLGEMKNSEEFFKEVSKYCLEAIWQHMDKCFKDLLKEGAFFVKEPPATKGGGPKTGSPALEPPQVLEEAAPAPTKSTLTAQSGEPVTSEDKSTEAELQELFAQLEASDLSPSEKLQIKTLLDRGARNDPSSITEASEGWGWEKLKGWYKSNEKLERHTEGDSDTRKRNEELMEVFTNWEEKYPEESGGVEIFNIDDINKFALNKYYSGLTFQKNKIVAFLDMNSLGWANYKAKKSCAPGDAVQVWYQGSAAVVGEDNRDAIKESLTNLSLTPENREDLRCLLPEPVNPDGQKFAEYEEAKKKILKFLDALETLENSKWETPREYLIYLKGGEGGEDGKPYMHKDVYKDFIKEKADKIRAKMFSDKILSFFFTDPMRKENEALKQEIEDCFEAHKFQEETTAREADKQAAEQAAAQQAQAKAERVRELEGMKPSELKKRAKEAGVPEAELEKADDADDVKAAVTELILAQAPHPSPEAPAPAPAKDLAKAQIQDVEIIAAGGDGDTAYYNIKWMKDGTIYTVSRRYSEFKDLKKSLKRAGANINSIPFPNRTLKSGANEKVVQKRRPVLENFLKKVVGMYNGNESTESASGIIYEFLKGDEVQASSPPPKSEPNPAQVAKPAQPPVEARVTDETAAQENRYLDL